MTKIFIGLNQVVNMSAAFKNAKKKPTQSELRRLINEHKNKKEKVAKKIESPLAKYNEAGQLTCILCNSVVRSEAVWTVHINAKQHKQNVEQAKKLKERTNNFTTSMKRPLTPPLETPPEKKPKSILKNGQNLQKGKPSNVVIVTEKEEETPEQDEPSAENNEMLPEGFFDDPKLDAKARNVEYKDAAEEEWTKFQKEIREADYESLAMIAEDQEEATTERQIEEIDEQMKNFTKVLDLEKKKVQVITIAKENHMEVEESLSNDEDDDFDEYLDWRSKKS